MKNIIASTRLYKNYQLAIPKAIRNKMEDLDIEDTVIDWYINEDNDIVIRPRKKVCLELEKKYVWKMYWELLKMMIPEMQLNLKGASTNEKYN